VREKASGFDYAGLEGIHISHNNQVPEICQEKSRASRTITIQLYIFSKNIF
jgi:hypothetical protein